MTFRLPTESLPALDRCTMEHHGARVLKLVAALRLASGSRYKRPSLCSGQADWTQCNHGCCSHKSSASVTLSSGSRPKSPQK
jgi:hypothetical protein